MEGEGGQPAMNISPFCPFTDQDTIEMKHSDCLFNVKANDELSEFYKQATKKSSLVTPPKKSIIMP